MVEKNNWTELGINYEQKRFFLLQINFKVLLFYLSKYLYFSIFIHSKPHSFPSFEIPQNNISIFFMSFS